MNEDASENPHLIEELEQYRRILDNIPAEIGVFDPEGRFLFNTPSGIRHAGTREWVLGKTHHDWCRKRGHPIAIADRRQQVIETCVRERRGESFEELWIDRRDGHRRHYLRTFSPVLDSRGEVSHVIGFGQEITELKKVEEELREALSEVAALQERLEAENVYLREEISAHHDVDGIVGFSAPIKNVLEAIATVGPTQANVVIYGETGTGKELVARALHAASDRNSKPLIKVNCASIPKNLFESEFFGHVRGSFTGAVRDRAGRFELAAGGTLFLDEVGEIPLDLQGKLLRVLQEGEYERIGEDRTRRVDVRVIAATNRNLRREISVGRFREDLYYRLNVFPIDVPSLRRRREDIPLLVRHYLTIAARKLGRRTPEPDEAQMERLQQYEWPGNVRELQNVIERAVITARGGRLAFELPGSESPTPETAQTASPADQVSTSVVSHGEMERRVRENIGAALRRCDGRVYGPNGAAQLLGMKPTTLASRLRRSGLAG